MTTASRGGFFVERYFPFLGNMVWILGVLLFYWYDPIPAFAFVSDDALVLMGEAGAAYAIYAILYYSSVSRERIRPTKGLIAIRMIAKNIRILWRNVPLFGRKTSQEKTEWTHEEKTALLFILVKAFFLPVMLNFAIDNFRSVSWYLSVVSGNGVDLSISGFNSFIYPGLIALLLLIDVVYFTFGYTFESAKLKNTVRSVEPTFFGWFVALICYPPFNGVSGSILGWYANEPPPVSTELMVFWFNIAGLFFFTIYVWATLALGSRSSNLTNRGIVGWGPYRFMRHPAYVTKNMAWWLLVLPLGNPTAYISMGLWTLVYYFRAITEERHLSLDPEYQAYKEKVRYKFVPGVW